MFSQLKTLLHITRSHGIIRRYFVVNGFDGALTILGLCMGFYFTDQVQITVGQLRDRRGMLVAPAGGFRAEHPREFNAAGTLGARDETER